jgi:hypothetical protein
MPAFVEPSWVKNAKQTIGTGVEPVYPMKTVHGGNQVPDTEANPIGYRYDNGRSQYQYLDLTGKPTDLVSRGNLGEAIRTLAPIGLSMIGANFLGPALGDLFGADIAGIGSVGSDALVTPTISGSVNQAIASGLAPGSAGAAAAASGGLTAAQLAAAGGLVTNGSLLSNIATLAPTVTPGTTPLPDVVPPTATPGTPPPPNVGPPVLPPVVEPPFVPPTATPGTPPPPDVGPPVLPPVVPPPVVPPVVEPPVVPPPVVEPPVVEPPVVEPPVVPPPVVPPVVKPPIDTSWLTSLTGLTGLTGTQLAALLSGLTGAGNAANLTSAINTGLDATTAANTASQGVLKDIYNQQLGFQKPYQATGTNALSQLGALGTGQYQQYDPVTGQPTTMGTGSGYLQHQFDASDLAKGLAPNYDFMLQQGQMANQRAANVGGGALSGNTLQGLNKYTQDYAGNAYQNAFTNYQNQRQNIYNNLSGLAGIGQTANTGAQAAGTAYGKGTTDLNTALANAQAAASIGKAQALGQGTTGLANSTFLSSLLGQNTSPAATTSNAGNVLSSLTGGAGNFLSSLFGNNTTTSGNLPI